MNTEPDMLNPADAVNWNRIEDETDLLVWDRLLANFWIPDKIPVSNDLSSWNNQLTDEEKTVTKKILAGLTALDTLQTAGAAEVAKHALTPHEEAVMAVISFNEAIHARSYSNIFSTLISSRETEDIFRWVATDEVFQRKAQTVRSYYEHDDPHKMRIASVMLESFLFYSGFYWLFYLSSQGKLTNSADIIRLICREEAIHGFFIGHKYQQSIKELSAWEKANHKKFTLDLAKELYDNEVIYTRNIYDDVGRTEDVMHFIRYNMNKALMNLGYEPWFDKEQTKVSASIMASLSPVGDETHDFFSGAGSSYVIGEIEELDEDEWSF